jgi:hypothetical protein
MSIIKYDIELIFVNIRVKYAKYSNGAGGKKEK